MRCTFINAYTEEACGGCGGANKKRERLLRERRQEVEKLGRLQSARESRDRYVDDLESRMDGWLLPALLW